MYKIGDSVMLKGFDKPIFGKIVGWYSSFGNIWIVKTTGGNLWDCEDDELLPATNWSVWKIPSENMGSTKKLREQVKKTGSTLPRPGCLGTITTVKADRSAATDQAQNIFGCPCYVVWIPDDNTVF